MPGKLGGDGYGEPHDYGGWWLLNQWYWYSGYDCARPAEWYERFCNPTAVGGDSSQIGLWHYYGAEITVVC